MAPKAEAGGGDDADDDDDELDDDEVHEEDDDKSEDELRAELKATRDSSAVRRKKIRELKGRLAAQDAGSGGRPAATDDDSKPDVDAIEKGGAARGRAEALSMVKKSGTRAALASAGVPKERLAKAVGLINLDDLDVDDEGEIDGLEDAVEELRKDWPEIFGKTVSRRRSVSGDTDSDGDRAAKVSKLTATERQAQSLVPGARLTVNK
jgi:hypothetical protein